MKLTAVLLTFALILSGRTGWADNEEPPDNPSSVSIDARGDNEQTNDFNFDLALAATKKSSFLIGGGKETSPVTATSPDNLDTREFHIGFSQDAGDSFTFTLMDSLWGQKDQIVTNSLSSDMKWLGDDWTLGLTPGLRAIIIYDQIAIQNSGESKQSRLTVFDPYLAASVKYRGLSPLFFKAGAEGWSYSKNMARLNSPALQKLFSGSALTLANNFLNYELTAEAGYSFDLVKISFEYDYTISALDNSGSSIDTIKSTWYLSNHWDFELDGGQSPSPSGSQATTTFISLGATYSWW